MNNYIISKYLFLYKIMIENYLHFIKKKLESTNYFEYYDDIIHLLENNHQNIQNLLLNKELNFENILNFGRYN